MRPLPLCLGLLAASLVAVAGSSTSEVTAAADLLNITDLEISDLSSDQEAVVHVNTNTLLLEAGEEEDNDTMSRPQLSVTVDYETPEDTGVEAAEDEDKYLSLDSYNVHSPQFHPQMTEIEFSDWYFLFLSPDNSTTAPVSPRSEAPLPSSSSSSSSSSVSAEVTSSLAEKLHVPASQFSVSSVEQYRSGSLSVNLSLTSHTAPGLHRRLLRLPHSAPAFPLLGSSFRLVQVFHDKNQHLYINNNMSSLSTLESLGLLITLTLGGLGMFLVVLTVTFVLAKIVTRPADFERFTDLGDGEAALMETEPCDYGDPIPQDHRKDIFLIEDVEGCIVSSPPAKAEDEGRLEDSYDKLERRPRRLARLGKVWDSLVSGRWRQDIMGAKFIELQP